MKICLPVAAWGIEGTEGPFHVVSWHLHESHVEACVTPILDSRLLTERAMFFCLLYLIIYISHSFCNMFCWRVCENWKRKKYGLRTISQRLKNANHGKSLPVCGCQLTLCHLIFRFIWSVPLWSSFSRPISAVLPGTWHGYVLYIWCSPWCCFFNCMNNELLYQHVCKKASLGEDFL